MELSDWRLGWPVPDKYSNDAKAWLLAAEVTYAGAYTLFHSENPFMWFPASILAHHTLEMYLKAALIRQGHTITQQDVWGHDLLKLAKQLRKDRADFPLEEVADGLRMFDAYFKGLRYPTELKEVEGLGNSEAELLDKLVSKLKPFAKGED